MRILLGNHQLESRAGSELFTAELASAFQARGHEVAVFTFFKGAIAGELEAADVPVFEPEDQAAIVSFAPKIVQTNHLPCAHFLRAVVPAAIRVHAILGVTALLESPPLDGGAYELGLVISEEVRDSINRTAFGKSTPIEIFRNWFNEEAVVEAPDRGQVTRIAVVSNHIAPALSEALRELAADACLEVDYFGIEHNPVVIDGSLLANYDCVVSIGRTAILAAACGVPCVMADIHGSDGLMTAQTLDAARRVNFSGRLAKTPITAAHLKAELAKIPTLDRRALRASVLAEYALSARAEWLLARYEGLSKRRLRGALRRLWAPEVLPPREGLVHAELAAEVRRLRKALAQTR